jgi:hypothetical protein
VPDLQRRHRPREESAPSNRDGEIELETISTDADLEFERIADELYAARPDEFASARDEAVRKARADGRPELARELAKLRKPTQSAWLVNLLWRDQREVMEQLFELAAELTRAQAGAAGEELRSLTAQRRQLESALLRQAQALAAQSGVRVTDTVAREAQETLAAALANPEVADEVRTGRLVKSASYAGFGVPASGVAPSRAPTPAAVARPPAQVDEKAAVRAARVEAAEKRLREARAALQSAASALADSTRELQTAQQRRDDLHRHLDGLREQLRKLEQEVASAEETERAAARGQQEAERAHAAAERDVERAEQALQDA